MPLKLIENKRCINSHKTNYKNLKVYCLLNIPINLLMLNDLRYKFFLKLTTPSFSLICQSLTHIENKTFFISYFSNLFQKN